MYIKSFNDGESLRSNRNKTNNQKNKSFYTKEGVIINSHLYNEDSAYDSVSLSNTKDELLISDETNLPNKIYEHENKSDKSLLKIGGISVGIMSILTGVSMYIKRNAAITNKIAKEKWITSFTRNISINEETVQAIVQMVQNPNHKTVRAGLGVLTLTAGAFMSKTFVDGVKEIWVKKKEADIQKQLQENLIEVENQSFSGKLQIIRNIMSEKTKLFSKYLSTEYLTQQFGMQSKQKEVSFGESDKANSKNNPLKMFLFSVGTVATLAGLTLMTLKNIRTSSKEVEKFVNNTKNDLADIAKSDKDEKYVKECLSQMLQAIDATEDDVKNIVNNTNWDEAEKDEFIKFVIQKIKTSTTKVNPNIGGDGTQKPSFSSFVDDYRAFFYNFLIEPDNQQFQQLFIGTTALTIVSYCGKVIADAIKEVQVKKINAQTELELQQRLVSTELRNFKAKKDSAVEPLVDEFFKKVAENKPKEDLKNVAENILLEIKNGPPFVYS